MAKKLLVSLYAVSNGFMAETASGQIIVEMELSKMLESVGAQLTSEALSDTGRSDENTTFRKTWERIR